MNLNDDYWETRYLNEDMPWDVGNITPPLKIYFDQLVNKDLKILIPGCGNAYEAIYLLQKGFQHVFVLDWAEAPLKKLAQLCPSFPKNQLLCKDFFALTEQFDLIIEQTFFCALNIEQRPLYAQKMQQLLHPKGKLVGVLFDWQFDKQGPPFGGDKKEYEGYFAPYFNFKYFDPCYNSLIPRKGRELFINLEKNN